jgi:MFS family permease
MNATLRTATQIGGAPALLVAVGIARLGVPALSLAMLLAARDASGSYGAAALVSAAFAIAAASSQLPWGRLADRHGARPVLQSLAIAQGLALFAFAALAHREAGVVAMAIAAALAGLCFPPMGTASRAAWQHMPDEQTRRALFALDGLTTELTLILGPLLASTLVAIGGGPFAVALGAAMVVISVLTGARSPLLPSASARPLPSGLFGSPPRALVVLLMATVAMAAALGAATVSGVALADRAGFPEGLPLTLMAVGGVVGVLAWSSRPLALNRRSQLIRGLVLYAAAVGTIGVAPTAVAVLLFVVAGGLMAPCDALQAQLCGEAAPPARLSESFAWLNSANWIGYAGGTAISGLVLDQASISAGYVACALAAVAAAGLLKLVRRDSPDERRESQCS